MTMAVGGRAWVGTPQAIEDPARIRWAFCLFAPLLTAIMVLASADSLLGDPDNWWHVRVGLDLLANWSFPVADSYSHTFAGQPWIAKEWLGQLLMASAYAIGGWNGVALITVASIALMVFALAWHFTSVLKPIAALALTLGVAILVCPLYNARPIIFTLPIIVVWTAQLFDAAREERAPPMSLLPLLCLWANLHAAFTFGFVIALFAGLDLLRRVRFTNPRLLVRWVAFGLLCPLVSIVHPYGVNAILATFSVMSGNEAVALIGEWLPFDATRNGVQEGALLLAYFGLLVSGLRIGWAKALFFVLALHLYFLHTRFMYLPMLLLPVVAAADVAAQYPQLSAQRWAQAARDGLETLFAKRFAPVVAVMAMAATLAAAIFMSGPAIAPSAKTSADGAIAFARTHGLTARNVLNSYDLGGTLIFNGIKTFIDGRTDQLFLGGFMKHDSDAGLSSGEPLLIEEINKYDIGWALLVKNDTRVPFFDELPGWSRVYADAETIVYAREK